MHSVVTALLYCSVFSLPWEMLFVIPYVGTLARSLAYLALGLMPVAIVAAQGIRPFRFIHIWFACFIGWGLLSLSWTINSDVTWASLGVYVRVIGLAWMVWEFTPTIRQQQRLMLAFICGCIFSIVGQFLVYRGMLSAISDIEGATRVETSGMNLNATAYLEVMSVVFAYYLATSRYETAQWLRLCCWTYCPVAFFSILLTGSRGGLIELSFCLVLLSFWAMRRNSRGIILTMIVLIPAAVGAFYLLPQSTAERLLSVGESLQGRIGGRRPIWDASFEALKRAPVIGCGLNAGPLVIGEIDPHMAGKAIHNAFLAILLELGAIGLFFYVGIYLFLVYVAWQLPKQERFVWLTFIGLLVVIAMGGPEQYAKPFWMSFGLIASHCDTVRRQMAKSAAPHR